MTSKDTGWRIFCKKSGRLEIRAAIIITGHDLQINLAGGAAHIGAIAFATPNGHNFVYELPHHQEGSPALKMASKISGSLACNVAVTAGIHYDAIEKEEIRKILFLIEEITQDIIFAYK